MKDDSPYDPGIGSWPSRRARQIPHRIAWTFEGEHTTFAEVADRVDRIAGALRARGIAPGDRIAYLGINHPAMVEVLFAAARVGAITVFVNPRLSEREVQFILDDSTPRLLVRGAETGADFSWPAPPGGPVVPYVVPATISLQLEASPRDGELPYADLLVGDPVTDPHAADLDDTCFIMYTSGTTGTPKGALLSHGNILFNGLNTFIEYDLRPDEVCIAAAPMYHIAMLSGLVLPVFMKGGRTVIEPGFRADEMLRLFESERITCLFAVPAMMDALMHLPGFADADLSSLRTAIVGGAPVPMRILREWNERGIDIQQGYGLTETSPGISQLRGEDAEARSGSAGKPQFFVDLRFVTPDGEDVVAEGTGEILTRGPNVFSGYWQRDEATRDAFTAEGWFRTGDVAYVDDEGYLYLRDRIKDMYVSGGENVYPAEVESALLDIDGIAEAAVVAVEDERWGEVGSAVVVRRPGAVLSTEDILSALEGRLARYKRPRIIQFADSLPRTATGKLQKHLVRELLAQNPIRDLERES